LGGLGASRTTWLGSLAEPALILVFFTVGVLSASDNPYLMNHAIAGSPVAMALPTHVLGAVAFFMLLLAETGHIPVDNPSGTVEISMIEEPRILEYSGRGYAIAKWAGWIKLFVLSSVFMNVFVLPWGLGNGVDLGSGLLGIAAVVGKLAGCGGAIVIMDASFAKLRFFRIAEYLGAAFLLALIGIITSYVVVP
jgi:formate hydrogenlyase subunit 4